MTKENLTQLKTWLSIVLTIFGFATNTPLHARGARDGYESRLERVAAHLGDENSLEEQTDNPLAPEPEKNLEEKEKEEQKQDADPAATTEEKNEEAVLSISGDVRAEWQYITEYGVNSPTFQQEFGPFIPGQERICPHRETIRPSNPNCKNGIRTCRGPLAANDWDIDLNLYFEYRTPCCWAVAHIEFDNDAGVRFASKICGTNNCKKGCDGAGPDGTDLDCCNRVNYNPCGVIDCQSPRGSGDFEAIALRKAYWGYNICTHKKTRLDLEVGRRRLFDVFDSRIQFLSQFDGVTLRYTTQLGETTDFYWNAASFVVNEHISHIGWVAEVGFLNINDTGVDLKYSIIDWYKPGHNECCIEGSDGWRFINSQWTGAYRFNRDYFPVRVKLYGAVLYNHAAKPRFYTNDHKYPFGGYLGLLIGEVVEKGDWSVDMNIQYVGAQAIADADVCGIGRGNIRSETLTMAAGLRHATPQERRYATQNARGNANYRGFKIEGLYALTDNISIDIQFIHSEAAKPVIGGIHQYNKFKVEGICAFW